ncbi:MAG: hypothetical protein AB4058_21705 [Microcystaceae cyanobacterium]
MSKHSYLRSRGYSTGEMLSEGKLDVWELPEREPRWWREPEEEDEKALLGFSGLSDEQIEAIEKQQDEIWSASPNTPLALDDSQIDDDGEF